jgi:hypothetical protein
MKLVFVQVFAFYFEVYNCFCYISLIVTYDLVGWQ